MTTNSISIDYFNKIDFDLSDQYKKCSFINNINDVNHYICKPTIDKQNKDNINNKYNIDIEKIIFTMTQTSNYTHNIVNYIYNAPINNVKYNHIPKNNTIPCIQYIHNSPYENTTVNIYFSKNTITHISTTKKNHTTDYLKINTSYDYDILNSSQIVFSNNNIYPSLEISRYIRNNIIFSIHEYDYYLNNNTFNNNINIDNINIELKNYLQDYLIYSIFDFCNKSKLLDTRIDNLHKKTNEE